MFTRDFSKIGYIFLITNKIQIIFVHFLFKKKTTGDRAFKNSYNFLKTSVLVDSQQYLKNYCTELIEISHTI